MSTERVDFTRGAADRIANAVRLVEQGDRDGTPLRFGKVAEDPQRVFRVCTYSQPWVTGATATVTFYNQTTTPNTVTAYNLHANVGLNSGVTAAECSIARNGTAWYLVSVNLTKQRDYSSTSIQLLGHSTGATQLLTWYSATTCAAS